MTEAPKPLIGVVGVGRMGLPVLERLSGLGYPTVGFRRSWPAEINHVRRLASPREIADRSQVIFTCLPSDAALLEVIQGPDGLVKGAITHKVVIDLSMTRLDTKQQASAALVAAGAAMLDAPISGTPLVAAAGKATLFVSGEPDVYQRVRPVFEFAAAAPLVGPFGAGTKLKYIANLLIGIHIAAAAEAIALAEHAGVDAQMVVELISGSVAASEMFRHRAPRMVQRDFDAPMNDVNAFLKDVALISDFARSTGSQTDLFDVAGRLYARAAERGLGEKELSAVVTLLRDDI
jgi:putative dehydrogenase